MIDGRSVDFSLIALKRRFQEGHKYFELEFVLKYSQFEAGQAIFFSSFTSIKPSDFGLQNH